MMELSKADVFIHDQVGLREKLQALLEGGAEHLHVLLYDCSNILCLY